MPADEKVEVLALGIVRRPVAVPALRELYGISELPLAGSTLTLELRGVPTAVVNALRRILIDELPGHRLRVAQKDYTTTDRFMLPQFVCGRLESIRLGLHIPSAVIAELRLGLKVVNESTKRLDVCAGDLTVTRGRLPPALFNPTVILAELQPGQSIAMQDIEIQTGFGRDHATFNNATRTFITHLDLEQYSDSEIRNGIASDLSGYKTSSLVANPRHHRLTVSFPATGEDPGDVRAFLAGACRAVAARLRIIANATSDNEARGAQYSAVALQGGLFEGTLLLPGETHTIGALMRRYVYVVDPGVSFLGYDVDEHKNWLTLTVRSASDVTATITRAAAIAIGVFATIQAGIEKIPLSPAPGKGARA